VRGRVRATGKPAHEWGLVVIAAGALVVWAWAIGTLLRMASAATIVIN
jgi:hypothetical protein